jgi:hypothetical protein
MDIFGIKYFARSAFGYLRGTAREGRILRNSVSIIHDGIKNANAIPDENARYDMQICAKNAFLSIFIYGFVFLMCIAGVFWCASINLSGSAIACFAMAVVFGLLVIRSQRDYSYISEVLLEKKRG